MVDADRMLKPANENPWYVLMTLYGEQVGEELDEELHEKNRAAWNAWSCQAMSEEEREKAAKSSQVTVAELSDWLTQQHTVTRRHKAEMLRRNGKGFAYPGLPDAAACVDLTAVVLVHNLVMKSTVFSGEARFDQTTFGGFATFDLVTLNGDAQFSYATFSGNAWFRSTLFRGHALFNCAIFSSGSGFHSTMFSREALFEKAIFSQGAGFILATFSGRTEFISATFSGDAVFRYATFSGDVDFISATFSRAARFGSATFNGGAEFRSATFSGEAEFRSATFSGFVYFPEAEFGASGAGQGVDFTDCQFGKPTSFRDAKFHARFPDFAGAVLHDKTTLTDTPANWPQGTQSDPAQAKASCATIRHNLGKQGLPEAEHFFFRREMGFAGRTGSWWQRPPYWVFGWVSDYGYSILTPFLWLCLLIVGGGYALGWGLAGSSHAVTFDQGLGLSFANVFNFLAFHKTFATETFMGNLPSGLKAFSGFQSIAGVVLLFFLGLGLRTRFRMR